MITILGKIILPFIIPLVGEAKSLQLIKTGILHQDDPIERYYTLYDTHVKALNSHTKVDYTGIDSLTIEIPNDAKSIPLTFGCDFNNLKLSVINKAKNFELFTVKAPSQSIDISCYQIDHGDFRDIETLKEGQKLLIIVDSTAWVEERIGYGYSHFRKDILLLNNGVSKDLPIMNYSDSLSRPYAKYVNVDSKGKEISNVHIYRSEESTFRTICLSVENQNNLFLKNVSIVTPKSDLTGDEAIKIRNSINIKCSDITIKGTYSQKKEFGYGIGLNNVANIEFNNLQAEADWGIFGNNNLREVAIWNSDINRFDVHCYGKNVYLYNTILRGMSTQMGSFFGRIVFDKCSFIDYRPITIRDSYMVNTKFDAIFNDCIMEWNNRNYIHIVSVGKSQTGSHHRPILQEVSWPNVYMNNVTLISNNKKSLLTIYNTANDLYSVRLSSNLEMRLKNLNLRGFIDMAISNTEFESDKTVSVKIDETYMTNGPRK